MPLKERVDPADRAGLGYFSTRLMKMEKILRELDKIKGDVI